MGAEQFDRRIIRGLDAYSKGLLLDIPVSRLGPYSKGPLIEALRYVNLTQRYAAAFTYIRAKCYCFSTITYNSEAYW